MVGLRVSPIVTGAGGGELEALHGEGEIVVFGVIDQEPVVDILLDAFCLVAFWDKWALLVNCGALFNPDSLAQSLVMSFDIIDNDSPLSVSVDGSQRNIVSHIGRAKEGFISQLLETVHRVVCVSNDIFVK